MAGKGFDFDVNAALPDLGPLKANRCGDHDGRGLKISVVSSRFNYSLVGSLVESTVGGLRHCGVPEKQISIAWVPGAYELPVAIQTCLAVDQPDALIACGVVLQGETLHAQMIANSMASAFTQLSLESSIPILDGTVVANDLAQAEARCLSGRQSRGWYAALAAVETATLLKRELRS